MANNDALSILVGAIVVLALILLALAAPIMCLLKGTEWWKRWETQNTSAAKYLIVLMKIGLTLEWSLIFGIVATVLAAFAAPTCGLTLYPLFLMYGVFWMIWKDL